MSGTRERRQEPGNNINVLSAISALDPYTLTTQLRHLSTGMEERKNNIDLGREKEDGVQRERGMSSAEGATEGPQGTQVAQKLECWGVAGRRVVGKGQGTSVDLEEGVDERVEDTLVVKV